MKQGRINDAEDYKKTYFYTYLRNEDLNAWSKYSCIRNNIISV